MKAAIITEDQIKAIENAMMYFVCGDDGKTTTGRYQADKVFDIVKSLKVQEPVAWFDYDSSAQLWVQVYPNTHGKPLYTGEQP